MISLKYSQEMRVWVKCNSEMAYKLSNIKKVNPIDPVCRKTTYYTQEEAQDMISYIKENRSIKEIRAYKCTICGFWHLTSKSR